MGQFQIIYPDAPNPDIELDFEIWQGAPPPLLKMRGQVHTRPGVDGAALQLLGSQSTSERVSLIEHFASYAAAEVFRSIYAALPSQSPVNIVYANVDYEATHGVKYFVTEPLILRQESALRLIGPGYDYTNGAAIELGLTLTPVEP